MVSRCGTKVFLMDMVRGKSGLYHKQCLSCATCKSGSSNLHHRLSSATNGIKNTNGH